jgi:serine/threonine-protein kinase
MLVGEPPYLGNTAQAVLGKIIQGLPVSATAARKTVPAHVDAAIRRALEKLPADRFTRAADFGAALSDPTFRHGAESQPPGAEGTGPWKRISVATTSLAAIFAIALGWALLRPDVAGPVVRYRVALPGGQAGGDGFALAPDGSWLTYVGPGSSPGETQLWVKARDQLDATPLAGTTGAEGMAVSPDGNWIAFAASGQLRRIPAGGGVATTIADGVSRFPPIWLDDGMLAYSDPQSRLQRVPSAGGISEVVFTAPAGRFAIPVTALPDGRGFLFLNCRATCSSSGDLWVADGGSGETRLLLPDAGWAAYAGGRLLFAGREDGVFGVPFDLATLGVEGAPVRLFDAAIMPQRITLSASGTMAYMPWEGRDGLSAAVWVSRDGDAVPMDTTWGFQTDINLAGWSLSPDHMRLAITLGGQSSPQDVWIKELDGGPVSRLTFNDSTDIRPRWTPDGRGLTFISNRAGDYDLYRRRSDGTGADSLLLDLETPIFEALWSPDGEWLVLRVGGGSIASRDIMALQVERDTVPRPLLTAPHDEEQPALSPDGRWMAYVSTETGRQEVFVRPFPEVEAGKWQVSTAGGTSPVWAHSGQELFFVNGDREVMSQAVLPGAAFQRGGLRMLFSMAGYEVAPNYASFDISPDDRRFLVVRRKDESGPDEVLVVVENWLTEVERLMESRNR